MQSIREKIFGKSGRRFAFWASLFALCSLSGYLLADDDEEGEEEEEHERRAVPAQPSATGAPRPSTGPVDTSSRRTLPQATNAKWKEECSSCHTLYHPGLLPARSWGRVMAGLSQHFGENASLDPAVAAEITQFLVWNAADQGGSSRGTRIAASIPAREAPLRITETSYFLRKHDELSPSVFKRASIKSPANCLACHPGAEQGSFDEHRVKIPR